LPNKLKEITVDPKPKEMKTAKSILFRANLKGYGIVNYDGGDQRFTFNALAKNQEKSRFDNVTYAKKQWTSMGEDGKCDYKIIISSDCLKHELFKEDVAFQSPNIMHHKSLLLNNIASPAMLLRGYMFATKEQTLKRSGAITLTDAIQTCKAISSLETFSRSGEKITDENQSDTSFFKKETIGDVSYLTRGAIDLMQLQLLSTDQTFDRLGLDPDLFEEYVKILSTRMVVDAKLGYYKIKDSIIDIPEYGVLFSNENVVELTKLFLKKLLKFSIKKSKAFADVVDVEYKIIYDPLTDRLNDENGWTILTSDTLDSLTFEVNDFYVPVDYDEAQSVRTEMNDNLKAVKAKSKAAKDEKDAAKTKQKAEKAGNDESK
jgi:hypothetical protein